MRWLTTLLISLATSAAVTLQWDANPEPDIAGYRVYYGEALGNLSDVIDVGLVTTAAVPDPQVGKGNEYAVTAYNEAGLESELSHAVHWPFLPGTVIGIRGWLEHKIEHMPSFIDDWTDTDGSVAVSSVTVPSVAPSGSDRYLLVFINEWGVGSAPLSVIFNGSESLSKLTDGSYFNASGRSSVWRLINPTATTANLVISWGSAINEYAICVAAFSGVHQTTPESEILSSYTTGSDKTLSPATSETDLVIGTCGYNGSLTLTDYQTTASNAVTVGYCGARISTKAASSPNTSIRYYMYGVDIDLSMAAFALKPSSATASKLLMQMMLNH